MSYYDYDVPCTCPYCGNTDCRADYVDIGIGMEQCSPFFCDQCTACQIGPYDKATETMLSEEERKTRWYLPNRAYLTSAPTLDGKPIGHELAKTLYELGLLDTKDD